MTDKIDEIAQRLNQIENRMRALTPARQIGGPFAFKGSDPAADIAKKYGFEGELARVYTEGSPQLVTKWHHYIPIYDRLLQAWRGTPVRFLEIGVSKGGSLSMWRRYLGDEAIIFGIDIAESCRQFDGIDGQVRIGSQVDRNFVLGVVEEMGGVDIVLDDGSHEMRHIPYTLSTLFSHVTDGGLYMIEDLHTAYWPGYGGGVDAKGNFFNYVRQLMDDMHCWYHTEPMNHPEVSDYCTGIEVYDSVCVLHKGKVHRPTHSRVQNT